MPTYRAYIAGPEYQDLVIKRADNSAKLGTIRVKPSSVLWKPPHGQRWYALSLADFAALMVEHGRLVAK